MYTSRLEAGNKKEEDDTTNLLSTIHTYNKLRLFTITESKSKQRYYKKFTYCELDKYSLENI